MSSFEERFELGRKPQNDVAVMADGKLSEVLETSLSVVHGSCRR